MAFAVRSCASNSFCDWCQPFSGAGSCQYTARYRINRLVYVETTDDVRAAIRREKELKAWSRAKRVALIESANPAWNEWPI